LPELLTPREPRLMPDFSNTGDPCGLPSVMEMPQRLNVAPRSLANRRYFPSGDQPIIVSSLGPVTAGTSRLPSTASISTSRWSLLCPTGASKPRYLPSGEKNILFALCQSADFKTRSEPSRAETRPICCVPPFRCNCTAIQLPSGDQSFGFSN